MLEEVRNFYRGYRPLDFVPVILFVCFKLVSMMPGFEDPIYSISTKLESFSDLMYRDSVTAFPICRAVSLHTVAVLWQGAQILCRNDSKHKKGKNVIQWFSTNTAGVQVDSLFGGISTGVFSLLLQYFPDRCESLGVGVGTSSVLGEGGGAVCICVSTNY